MMAEGVSQRRGSVPPLYCAALVVLLEGLCFTLVLPVMGYFNESLGGGPAWLGLLFALVSGPKVLTNPLFGRLSDLFGRRPILFINTIGTLAGSVLWALSANLFWLTVSRAVTGVFSAQAGVAMAVAADGSPPHKRAGAMGMLGAAFGLAFGLGPPLGGWLALRFGYAAVGWTCAGLQTLSLLVILLLLPETCPGGGQMTRAGESGLKAWLAWLPLLHPQAWLSLFFSTFLPMLGFLGRPRVGWLLLTTVCMTFGLSEMVSTFTVLAKGQYGFNVARTGYAFGAFGLIGILVQGGGIRWMTARFGDRATALTGLLALAAGLGLLALRPPLWGFWTVTGLMGLGSALAMPCLNAMLSRCVGEREQGGISGLNQSAIGLGRAGGNALGGWLYQHAGVPVPYASAAVFALLAFALLWPARELKKGLAKTPVPS